MASVRLKHGTSLLLDTGSPGNICGDKWSQEMAFESQSKVSRSPEYKRRDQTMTCRGIGTGSQSTNWDVRHVISLGTGRLDTFTAPELPDSETPGILGRVSMRHHRMLLDTFSNVAYMVGPGGYELKLSPGSEKLDLQDSPMGHMMLPCSEFRRQDVKTKESVSFVVGEYYAGVSGANDGGPTRLARQASADNSSARFSQPSQQSTPQSAPQSVSKIFSDADRELEGIFEGVSQRHSS